MRYDDYGHEESYCLDILPGRGDESPELIRTRCFMLANQTEWGYAFSFQPDIAREFIDVMFGPRHWSDPVVFAC